MKAMAKREGGAVYVNPEEKKKMLRTSNAVRSGLELLLYDAKTRSVTVFLSADSTVKLTHRHKPDRRARSVEFVLTLGAPAYADAKLVKKARKAGVDAPRVAVRHYPAKKKK